MKRRNLTPKQNSSNIEFTDVGLRHVILREPSVVDEFYREKSVCPEDKKECISILDPIIILFNQDRLNKLGSMGAQSFIDSLAHKSNSLQELRKKCSDDDLMTMIKSRHLQSPAEILAWCRYMNDNINEFNKEVQRLVDEQKQTVDITTSVETSTDSNSSVTS